jgi:hypothetical protein
MYAGAFNFDMKEFISYMEKFDRVIYLFNNRLSPQKTPDTEESIKFWLKTFKPDINFSNIEFWPKQYWYMRDILDSGLATENQIINLYKMMIMFNRQDAEELDISSLGKIFTSGEIIDNIKSKIWKLWYDPRLIYDMSFWTNIILVGGLKKQCLAEIEIFLKALDISFKENDKYIYG